MNTDILNFSLGVAFTGLNEISEPLYPMICSTAAKTEMSLGVMKREFLSMQDRCRATIIRSLTNEGQIEQLLLPRSLKVSHLLVHCLRHPKNLNILLFILGCYFQFSIFFIRCSSRRDFQKTEMLQTIWRSTKIIFFNNAMGYPWIPHCYKN